jgi:ABC-type antimicrobial peptide transport system permease subunit
MQVAVSPGYFDVLQIGIREGRAFSATDVDGGEGVAVITPALARRYWPNEDAVGKRITIGSWRTFGTAGTSTPPIERRIVGVTEELSGAGVEPGPPIELLFAPMQQDPWRTQAFLLRASDDPVGLVGAVRAALAEIDGGRAIYDVRPLVSDLREAIDRERVTTFIVGAFALAALLLSGLGIYGVVAYSVTRRRREIGIRLALGANARQVTKLVAREGLVPVVGGTLFGLAGAAFAVRLLAGFLYNVEPLDPPAFIGAALLLGVAALGSIWVPARRTLRVDPAEAMQAE